MTATAIGDPPPPADARLAVVSGGGTGIGRASAEALLADGCAVLLLGRRPDVLDRSVSQLRSGASDGGVSALRADVGEPADVARVAETVARWGTGVSVLVNNA